MCMYMSISHALASESGLGSMIPAVHDSLRGRKSTHTHTPTHTHTHTHTHSKQSAAHADDPASHTAEAARPCSASVDHGCSGGALLVACLTQQSCEGWHERHHEWDPWDPPPRSTGFVLSKCSRRRWTYAWPALDMIEDTAWMMHCRAPSRSSFGGKERRTSCTPSTDCFDLSTSLIAPWVDVAGTVQ